MSTAENQTKTPETFGKDRELLQTLTDEIEKVMFHGSKDEAAYRGSCVESLFNIFMTARKHLEGTNNDVQ